jgi:7-cyano-7-deazaguanine synthase
MDDCVVLLSGGLDSSTLLHYVTRRLGCPAVHALSFAYGQKHGRELDMARRQAERAGAKTHRIVDLSVLAALSGGASALTDAGLAIPDLADLDARQRGQPSTYVPHRNLILLALAAAYAESCGLADVFYGAQAQDAYGYWDCTVDFVGRMNDLLALNPGRAVVIHAPFTQWPKANVVRLGLELGVDYAITWTCYRGGRRPCGTCPSCGERREAFRQVGVPDPLEAIAAGG